MEDKASTDDSRGKSSENKKDANEDPYSPTVLTEGPKKYRFEDWASI